MEKEFDDINAKFKASVILAYEVTEVENAFTEGNTFEIVNDLAFLCGCLHMAQNLNLLSEMSDQYFQQRLTEFCDELQKM